MFACPRCSVKLRRLPVEKGVAWCCPKCQGRTATVALLRKSVPSDVVQSLWKEAIYGRRGHGLRCPSCLLPMSEVDFATGQGVPVLDVCRRCHFIWFDAGEYETLPVRHEPPPLPGDRLRALESPAAPTRDPEYHVGPVRTRRRIGSTDDIAMPAETWKWLPGLMGMPVEFDDVPLARPAWTTYILLGLVSLLSLLAFRDLEGAIARFGFIPEAAGRHGGLTFFTMFFLHAGWFHLACNMYFLWVFGDNVEDRLGVARYLVLLVGATLVGNVAHWILTDDPSMPCVGASGGISGVIAYYALSYPRVRLGLLFFYFWWIRISALTGFFLWIGLQILGASLVIGNVAYGAHLGGAVVGVVFWWIARAAEK